MNQSELQIVYKYEIYPRGSRIYSDKGFVIIDDGSQKRTHWICFIIKNMKTFYFDNFGIQADNSLLNQLPRSKIYHN